ncbi:D-sedoheptulose-7-phosphate isomerase [Aliidiomarina haloalkalitolerans]|uniref:Phosphoheptose isomerase n=1 Tax=Aliidiomarina haloalkalitolerans TaxID=859059 RepID=A0A432VT53_9GAMM|nr:SIS domain-containing protein [Aliidiomarina haloalkalitolerans]MCL4410717.1 SIS domain-containing protein [Gammaproteobacteria bacterium]RUO19473.1 phosphoheptose isomerase [Aliidiomarina haloalkalitolerans]
MQDTIRTFFNESIQVQVAAADSLVQPLAQAVQLLTSSLLDGRRIFSCGDGNSTFVAQHFTDLLIHGTELERPPFPAVTLGMNSTQPVQVDCLARQLSALGSQGDILLAFVSQNHSERVHQAMEAALSREMTIIAVTGDDATEITSLLGPNDIEMRIPSTNTTRIVEQQLFLSQLLCDLIEQQIFHGG